MIKEINLSSDYNNNNHFNTIFMQE